MIYMNNEMTENCAIAITLDFQAQELITFLYGITKVVYFELL